MLRTGRSWGIPHHEDAKEEVTKLLAMDVDDPETYEDGSIGEDYREALKRKGDEQEHFSDYEFSDDEFLARRCDPGPRERPLRCQ